MTVTSPREIPIREFLERHGLGNARRAPIAGDASFRRYERILSANNAPLILMDAPPEKEDVRPFVTVQGYLWRAGYSVPEILEKDVLNGFLLLEDFGDVSFTRLLAGDGQRETGLYAAAVDALADFYAHGLAMMTDGETQPASYNRELLAREAGLLGEWFLPLVLGHERAAEAGDAFMQQLMRCFDAVDLSPSVLVHRDFHADNLFWLEGRAPGIRQVGMLDFQDAVLGRPAYDLVSLLEDARRDVSDTVVQAALARYVHMTGMDAGVFLPEYALYGAQRNAKILGIFARLCLRDGKPQYLSLIPRVWAHFMRDLSHPSLPALRVWLDATFTEEEKALIQSPNLAARANVHTA